MPKTKIIYLLIIILIAAGFLIWGGYYLGVKKEVSQEEKEAVQETFPSGLERGAIGEVMAKEADTGQEAPLVTPTMPPVIFSASGIVMKVDSDRVVIRSNGYHFADGVSREVTAILTAETSTFVSGQAFRWQGFFGLKQLQPGMEILVDSSENIRGKVEFKVKTINIL